NAVVKQMEQIERDWRSLRVGMSLPCLIDYVPPYAGFASPQVCSSYYRATRQGRDSISNPRATIHARKVPTRRSRYDGPPPGSTLVQSSRARDDGSDGPRAGEMHSRRSERRNKGLRGSPEQLRRSGVQGVLKDRCGTLQVRAGQRT